MAVTRTIYFQDDVEGELKKLENISATINEVMREHFRNMVATNNFISFPHVSNEGALNDLEPRSKNFWNGISERNFTKYFYILYEMCLLVI